MDLAVVLAGLALVGAALVVEQAQGLRPVLQPVRIKTTPSKQKSRS